MNLLPDPGKLGHAVAKRLLVGVLPGPGHHPAVAHPGKRKR